MLEMLGGWSPKDSSVDAKVGEKKYLIRYVDLCSFKFHGLPRASTSSSVFKPAIS